MEYRGPYFQMIFDASGNPVVRTPVQMARDFVQFDRPLPCGSFFKTEPLFVSCSLVDCFYSAVPFNSGSQLLRQITHLKISTC